MGIWLINDFYVESPMECGNLITMAVVGLQRIIFCVLVGERRIGIRYGGSWRKGFF